ncbi:sigma-70 family RNA polymerase sigma factor [Kiritimatiellaeota bacterium B1221]|nr:sigma-70 family RNA polymerase sigma factor [Kiritimatiellaeota bacterium B1221]
MAEKDPNIDPYHVERIQQYQDPDSFTELYQRHFQMVFRLIAKIVLDEAVAEELAQESFMKASQQIQNFRGQASFKTWICKIGVNAANGHLRRIITARRHSDFLRVEAEGKGTARTPRESLFWKEEHQQVSLAMEALTPVLRTALVLTVIEGMEVAEAAEVQGCSRGTMYWRVHQARKQLKEAMSHE